MILNAPAVFRFTGPACPDRHAAAAQALGATVDSASKESAGEVLAEQVVRLMQALDVPNGLSAIGYREEDIPTLVAGTFPQHQVTKISPRPAGEDDLSALFADAMVAW